MAEKERTSGDGIELEARQPQEPTLPVTEKPIEKPQAGLHPAVYVAAWISLSSSVILFNKYILATKGFAFRMRSPHHRPAAIKKTRTDSISQPLSSQHGIWASRRS